jgi:hypothetical protein
MNKSQHLAGIVVLPILHVPLHALRAWGSDITKLEVSEKCRGRSYDTPLLVLVKSPGRRSSHITKSNFCGPKPDPRPDLCSIFRAASESVLRPLPDGTRHFRFVLCSWIFSLEVSEECDGLFHVSPNCASDRGFSIMFPLYTGSGLAGPGCALVPPQWCPRRSCW